MKRAPGPGGVALDLIGGLLATSLVTGATWALLARSATFLALSGVVYGVVAMILFARAPRAANVRGLGAANRITLLRLALIVPLTALLYPPDVLSEFGRWWVVGLGTLALVLDGLDGRVARRTGTASAFGARFDMETDAFLLLVLSGLVWAEGRVGPWVLLVGGMRYLFVAAAWMLPALNGELFPSLRRRVVCVVQGAALLVALAPIIPSALTAPVMGFALASLTWSFAVDSVWLLRPEPHETG